MKRARSGEISPELVACHLRQAKAGLTPSLAARWPRSAPVARSRRSLADAQASNTQRPGPYRTRAFSFSDRRTAGQADCRTGELPDKRTAGQADCRTSGLPDKRTAGQADRRSSAPADQWSSGPADYRPDAKQLAL